MNKGFALCTYIYLSCVFHGYKSQKYNYHYVDMATTWYKAQTTCQDHGRLLQPEKGGKLHLNDLLDKLQIGDSAWINAKVLPVQYKSGPVYLKFSYVATDTELFSCLCEGPESKTRCKKSDAKTWQDAKSDCEKSNSHLFNVSTIPYAKDSIAILERNVSTWIQNSSIPSWGSRQLEECFSVTKHGEGLYIYNIESCSNKHPYNCINDTPMYAPTLTRLNGRVPDVGYNISVHPSENVVQMSDDKDPSNVEESLPVGGIVGGIMAVLIVAIVTVLVVRYVRKRRNQKRYFKSLRRYKEGNRHLGSSIQSTRTLEVSTTSQSDTLQFEEDKRKYVSLQNDVVRECNRKLSQAQTTYEHQQQVAFNQLKAYQSMNGINAADKHRRNDPGSYEDYNPSSGELLFTNGDVRFITGHGSDTYENTKVQTLPRKFNKTVDPTSRANAEETNKTRSCPVPKHSQQRTPSLGQLDQYENHDLPPKREKGKYALKPMKPKKAENHQVSSQVLNGGMGKANSQMSTNCDGQLNDKSEPDLPGYENHQSPAGTCKEVSIDDLVCYESYNDAITGYDKLPPKPARTYDQLPSNKKALLPPKPQVSSLNPLLLAPKPMTSDKVTKITTQQLDRNIGQHPVCYDPLEDLPGYENHTYRCPNETEKEMSIDDLDCYESYTGTQKYIH